MKIAILKTCLFVLSHFITQRDSFKVAADLYTGKQYEASIKMCNSEIKNISVRDSLYEKYLLLRASNYAALKDFNASIEDYVTLIKIKPKQIPYYVNLAYMYDMVKKYDNCFAVLETAYKITPNDNVLLNNLSYYSGQFSRYNDAIKYADIGLKLDADSMMKSALLNNRGYGCIGLKRYNEALNNINQAIKFDPTNSYAFCYRAIANIQTKKMKTVCADLYKSKELGGIELTADLINKYCTLQKM